MPKLRVGMAPVRIYKFTVYGLQLAVTRRDSSLRSE